MMSKPTLYLIDGNSYIYRAFYAIKGLTTSKGFPTNAALGFTNMLMKVAGEKKPDYLAVCFDPKGPTTRNAIFKDYKATRPPMPEGLVPQIPYIHRIVEAFNIPAIVMPGIEADDVIAAIARKAARAGFDVTLITGDKDLFQLIDENVRVYDTMKEAVYGPKECREKFGVPPDKVADLLGLTGDKSDNIPGVPGVGPKTAVELINEFGGVEAVIENVENIKKPRLRELIREHAESAKLSKSLVQFTVELPREVEVESLKRREQDSEALTSLFRELEFTALMKFVQPPDKTPDAESITITTEKALTGLVSKLRQAGAFALVTETTGGPPMWAGLVGLAVCFDETTAYYIPLAHTDPNAGGLFPGLLSGQIPQDKALELLRPVLEEEGLKKYGHNIKRDIIALKRAGVTLRGASFDSMVGSYLLNPGRARHELEDVSLEHLAFKKTLLSDVTGSGARQTPFIGLDIPTATLYSAQEAWLTFRLAGVISEKLHDEGLYGLFEDIELPLISALSEMELTGVYVDRGYLAGMSKELEIMLEGLTRRIFLIAGEEFNINSPKQLADILFIKLGLPPARKTKTGFSTDEETLTMLAAGHELPAEILAYRELFKLKSTYVDALPRLILPATGRVHTSLNQAVAATGRLSSSDPNLQNIPIRGDMGGRIRRAFMAPPGSSIISADYSQIELRIMAHLASDPSLIESFMQGEDVHRRTASEIFNIAPDSVTPDMRRHAKAVNFGIMYGMGAFGLSGQIGVGPKDAKKYIDAYFERHAGVKAFIETNLQEVTERGYSTTLFGRKRPIPELLSDNKNTRSLGERLAINTPIQGSAADIIKVAMINIARRMKAERLTSLMVLQVHDELVFEAREGELEVMKALVIEEMEGVIKLSVPIKVDLGVGKSWGEAH